MPEPSGAVQTPVRGIQSVVALPSCYSAPGGVDLRAHLPLARRRRQPQDQDPEARGPGLRGLRRSRRATVRDPGRARPQWRPTGQGEAVEDGPGRFGRVDRGDQAHASAAAGAVEDFDGEDPPQEVGPIEAPAAEGRPVGRRQEFLGMRGRAGRCGFLVAQRIGSVGNLVAFLSSHFGVARALGEGIDVRVPWRRRSRLVLSACARARHDTVAFGRARAQVAVVTRVGEADAPPTRIGVSAQ